MVRDLENIEKEAKDKYERMLDLSIKVTDDYNAARRLDVEQLRNLIIQISVVSFAAVGFSIPIIGSSSVVTNQWMFIVGLFFLGISAIGGLWYSAIAAENSILGSYKGYMTNKKEIDETIANQIFLMKHPDKYNEFVSKTEKVVKDLKEKSNKGVEFHRDKVLYVLLTILTLGILFIFISILPLCSLKLAYGTYCKTK